MVKAKHGKGRILVENSQDKAWKRKDISCKQSRQSTEKEGYYCFIGRALKY